MKELTLKDLKINENGRILKVGGEGALRQHFLDMGVIPGAEVTIVKFAPLGDPVEMQIHGYELTLRLEDMEKIFGDLMAGNFECKELPYRYVNVRE